MTDRRTLTSRAHALARIGAAAGLPSPELRGIARLAAHLAAQPYGLPMAALHLIDATTQHRVASIGGPPLVASAADGSMCLQVVDGEQAIYCVDASRDPRYSGNPNTSGPDPVRLYYAVPLRLSDGTTVGALCVFDTRLGDLAHQASVLLELTGLTRDLARVAMYDQLTGLANRYLLSDRLDAALADFSRASHEPALLLVDLNAFEQVNDRYGHGVGDKVLA